MRLRLCKLAQHIAVTVSRRQFLSTGLLTGAAALLPDAGGLLPAWAAGPVGGKDKDKARLIVNSYRFLDLETPVSELRTWITPVELFFVRNHVAEPFALDADSWRLAITGEVERPLQFSLVDLAKLEPATVVNTLECAGNGRAFYEPHVPGVQWRRGAVGTARFTGPRLGALLERAGLKSSARHVAFRGLDEPPGRVPPFVRSIPVEKAMDADTLVALQMNGAPLLKHHGFPARALVPGWIGAASVKWLAEIRVLDREFEGNFMKPGYRMPRHPIAPGAEVSPDETEAVTALRVKSIITRPAAGASAPARWPLRISGAAWAGEAEVARVEVSTDSGQTWTPAEMGGDRARYAWRLWEFPWIPPRPGSYAILARATDGQGRAQPARPDWNPSGYLWNGMDEVRLLVE